MNKHRYRVLFSKTLQRFIVTSELAKTKPQETQKKVISSAVNLRRVFHFILHCNP